MVIRWDPALCDGDMVEPGVNLCRILPEHDPAPLDFGIPVFRDLFGQIRHLHGRKNAYGHYAESTG